MYDRVNNRQRGFGFVTFATEAPVINLVAQQYVECNEKSVECKRAKPKETSPSATRRASAGPRHPARLLPAPDSPRTHEYHDDGYGAVEYMPAPMVYGHPVHRQPFQPNQPGSPVLGACRLMPGGYMGAPSSPGPHPLQQPHAVEHYAMGGHPHGGEHYAMGGHPHAVEHYAMSGHPHAVEHYAMGGHPSPGMHGHGYHYLQPVQHQHSPVPLAHMPPPVQMAPGYSPMLLHGGPQPGVPHGHMAMGPVLPGSPGVQLVGSTGSPLGPSSPQVFSYFNVFSQWGQDSKPT
jgi:hypothetical protein